MIPLAELSAGVVTYLQHVQFLNSETSLEMLNAEMFLFFGGVIFAFTFGYFSMTIRATRGAARDIDL